jgi:hypothetical protein
VESGNVCGTSSPVATSVEVNSREISTEEAMNRGEAFALPDEMRGVIPGAVEVAD